MDSEMEIRSFKYGLRNGDPVLQIWTPKWRSGPSNMDSEMEIRSFKYGLRNGDPVTHAGLREDAPRLCETTPVSWFPNGDIAKTKAYGAMLQELYGTLKKMEDALALLQERQKQSNPEDPLCRELERASLSVAGLLQNAQCAICLREGLAPTGIAPVWRTQSENLSYQKIEGCRILWSYSKFLKRLAKGFKRQANREERPARRKEAKRARLLA
ncbi:hypothetical protein JD844_015069 [Phrynosoma platyrhinos]|uniref:Leukemia inhibitory factor n=1 Tax=Phrynosoma platyrhinos TaxID=52577 RepID=A0ABQ7T8E8_PHRPL|nr:hypothetical protein JD844_015069 [Phrynosoma platyrhinos]